MNFWSIRHFFFLYLRHFLEVSYFLLHAWTDQWGIRIVYLFRGSDLVEFRKCLFLPHRPARAVCAPFSDPFFPKRKLTESQRRYGTHFQQRGFFSGFPDVDYPIRILCLVKGILGGFGTKDLLDSLLDKSTSPFRIELLLLRRNHPWERAEPRNSWTYGPR